MLRPLFVGCLLGAVSLMACTRDADDPAVDEFHDVTEQSEHESLDERQQYTGQGTYLVGLMSTPEEISVDEAFSLTLTVRDSSGAPLSESLEVRVDGFMPDHGHGMNTEARVADMGDGCYQVEGMRFHMPGEWVVYVDVVTGETTERATFDYRLDE